MGKGVKARPLRKKNTDKNLTTKLDSGRGLRALVVGPIKKTFFAASLRFQAYSVVKLRQLYQRGRDPIPVPNLTRF